MERWDEVLPNLGEVLVMVSTACHHGLPTPPPRPRHARGPVHSVDPRQKVCQRAAQHHPPTAPLLKKFLGTLEQQEAPTYGQLLVFWGGLEGHLG